MKADYTKNTFIVKYVVSIVLLEFLSIVCFCLENPNFIIKNGIGFLAFFSYLPVLLLVKKSSMENVWLYGGIFGFFSYALYGFWLFNYNHLLFFIICFVYSLFFATLFLLLKIVDRWSGKYSWIIQWLFICSFEYIKTLGVFGFSYGVTAYSQWQFVSFIQVASIIGVFGLNAIIIFPSCVIYGFLLNKTKRNFHIYKELNSSDSKESNVQKHILAEKEKESYSHNAFIFFGALWCAVFISCVLYGYSVKKSKIRYKDITVAAIQNNEHSWEDGFDVYARNIQSLMKLTDEALEINPDIQMVIWPETAVVPAIVQNYNNKNDEARNKLVTFVLQYINSKNCVFIIGNGHKEVSLKNEMKKYNSSLIFVPNNNVIPPKPFRYSKMHLVPFSEFAPYKNYFPDFYKKMEKFDFHHWDAGEEYKVFNYNDFYFSTPICFEDTFGEVCRNMAKNGARCFVNLSNDSWSQSEVCQRQHLAMAVFRSVENRVPSVRSTTSGITCIIDESGSIIKEAPEFVPTYVMGNIPVIQGNKKLTLYTRYGDYAGKAECFILILLLIMKLIVVTIKKAKRK